MSLQENQKLYIMKNSFGLFKVGISLNPMKRRGDIQNASGVPTELVAEFETVRNAMIVEREIHGILSEFRRHGEWFDYDEGELKVLCESKVKEVARKVDRVVLGCVKDASTVIDSLILCICKDRSEGVHRKCFQSLYADLRYQALSFKREFKSMDILEGFCEIYAQLLHLNDIDCIKYLVDNLYTNFNDCQKSYLIDTFVGAYLKMGGEMSELEAAKEKL